MSKRHYPEVDSNSLAKKSRNNEDTSMRDEAIQRAIQRISERKAKKLDEMTPNTTSKAESLRDRIAAAKANINKNKKSDKEDVGGSTMGRGLNVELHPLLSGKAEVKPEAKNPNLAKLNRRGFQINPYLSDVSQIRRKRELKFNESGKYIKEANEIRRQQKLAEIRRKIDENKRKAGLEPDLSIGEDKYKLELPPKVEWWDEPLLIDGDYTRLNEDAISIYVQHPIPIKAPWERHLPAAKPLFLTKKEMKRIRRNDRAERYKEQQDKIRLGLEPAPPPKVKLSNLMNALTNEAIKDPTAVEQRVRKEVEDRAKKHLAINEERKLSKEERHAKLEAKFEKNLQKGYFTAVFVVDQLVHPSHKFKIDMNATQLHLVGTLLYTKEFALIIVEGSEKSVNAYKKLITRRINWTDSVDVAEVHYDLSNNKCGLLWEGQLKDLHFKKWSIFRADDDETAIQFLARFEVDNYYREAKTLKVEKI